MKKSLSQMIAIFCILSVGFIGIISFTREVQSDPGYVAYRHTNVDCYARDSLGWMEFCRSFTVTTKAEYHPEGHDWYHDHGGHPSGPDRHEYGSVNRIYADCGFCY